MQLITKYFSDFSDEQLKQLAALEHLYKDWNEKINVISRKDIDSLYEKHVLHSLSIAAVFEFENGIEVIDIGTGGGFPGIPLAIYFSEVKFHLVDSIGKKLKIVNAVANEIGLKNVTTQHIRAEEIKDRKFHFVVSRAVAPLGDLWRWAKPLLKAQGTRGKVQARHKGQGGQGFSGDEQGNREQGTRNRELEMPGLICLKGGDLAQEIHDSRTRPRVFDISQIFQEDYFKEKYILYIQK